MSVNLTHKFKADRLPLVRMMKKISKNQSLNLGPLLRMAASQSVALSAVAPGAEPAVGTQPRSPNQEIISEMKAAARIDQLVLLGDAKGNIGITSESASTGFGGGVQYRTADGLQILVLRTSADDSVRDVDSAGFFLLSPSSSSIAMESITELALGADLLEAKTILAFRGEMAIGSARWATDTGSERATAASFDWGFGTRSLLVANRTNHVETFSFLNASLRVFGGDILSKRRQLLGTGQLWYPGFGATIGLLLGQLEIAARPVVLFRSSGAVRGLTGFQFNISAEFREGPVLTVL